MRFLRIGMLISLLLLVLYAGTMAAQTPISPPTPTITVTLTSQPGPPGMSYPPDGAVLTQSLTIQDFQFYGTGFMTYVTVTGQNFTARWCTELHGTCNPSNFENENEILPDGAYSWHVTTWKPLGSASSDPWHFRVETDSSHHLPVMLTATLSPTGIPAMPTPRGK